MGGTGNLVAPFPNGVPFFTEVALSFFAGPSKLDKGVLDFGGTGNFTGPLPNGVAFFIEDALSFFAAPSKLDVGIADLGGAENLVGPPPGDALLAESSPVVFDGPVKNARSPTDSFTVSLLSDGIALDGMPNFGSVVSFVSVDCEDLSSSFSSSDLAILALSRVTGPSFVLLMGPLKGGVVIPNFLVPSVLIGDFEVDDGPGMFILCFGGDPNGADVESLLLGNESSSFSWSEAVAVGEDPDGGPSF